MKKILAGMATAFLALVVAIQWTERTRAGSTAGEPARTGDGLAFGENSARRKASPPRSDPSPATAPLSAAGYVTVQSGMVSPRLEAYGQVQPISVLPVNAAQQGVVAALTVVPGTRVREGEELAHLSGPAIESALQQSEANVRSGQAQLTAAQKTLAIDRQQLPAHFSTRAAVEQAQSAVAAARASFENAQSHLQAVRQMMTITAPANGTVLAVDATEGELVGAGQPVVTLQTAARLWLEASYYGRDLALIHAGMTGHFSPADGSAPIPVRVRAVSGTMAAAQGEAVGMAPVHPAPGWINGEFGAVTLDLPPQKLVAVPTSSLILDQGKWWVLVRSPEGDRPQEVVPGPIRGWDTFLESGVRPGSQVVVQDAYLLFHRGVARHYTPPD